MKKLFYTTSAILVLIFIGSIIFASQASAQLSVLRPTQGGTGIGSATVGDVGDCIKVLDDTPFTFELGTCGGSSTPGGSNSQIQFNNNGAFGGMLIDYSTPGFASIYLDTQDATTTDSNGFPVTWFGSTGDGTGNGGAVSLQAGDGGLTDGNGGDFGIYGGNAQGGNGNAGNVILGFGAPAGAGTQGNVLFANVGTGNAQTLTLDPNSLTGNQTATFQDASGVIAYLSDIPTSLWEQFNGVGIRTTTVGDKVLIGDTATTTEANLEVVGSTAVTGNGASLTTDILDLLNLGIFYLPRLSPVAAGGLGDLLWINGSPIIGETNINGLCLTTNPCLSFYSNDVGSNAKIIFATTTSVLSFNNATEYDFDAGIKPNGYLDTSGDYGLINQVLTNSAGGGNYDWIDPSALVGIGGWVEFNQASRDTYQPDPVLGITRVAIGPTNLISSADTALNVAGGMVNIASTTGLMMNETRTLGWCGNNITTYSICLGNAGNDTMTGISNNFIGYQTGESNTTGFQNLLAGTFAGYGMSDSNSNVGLGYQALGRTAGATHQKTVAIGDSAMFTTATSSNSVAIGYEAFNLATTTLNSVGVGYQACKGAFAWGGLIGGLTGQDNTCIGYQAGLGMQANALGNTFLGARAGLTNASNYNTLIGTDAGHNLFGNSGRNVALGYNAMYGNVAGDSSYNTAIGESSLFSINGGDGNVALGTEACYSLELGFSNFCLGESSMYSSLNTSENTAIGVSSLFSNITGSENTAIGSNALQRNISATTTVAVGNEAGQGTGAYFNQGGVYVGYRAGENVQSNSDFNTFMGYYAGALNTTGASSTYLGYQVADNVTTGSHNLGLGSNIDMPSATASNQLNIGNIIFGTAIDGVGSTISTGNIGIATTSPSSLLQLFSTSTTTLSVDSNSATKGSCIEMKDIDGGGYTYIYTLDGDIYSSQTSCK
jgi:hypothetical protein